MRIIANSVTNLSCSGVWEKMKGGQQSVHKCIAQIPQRSEMRSVLIWRLYSRNDGQSFQTHNVTAHNAITHRILTSWSLPLFLNTIIRFLLSISAAIFSITKSFVFAYIDMCRHPDTVLLRKIPYPCYCGRFTSTTACRCATALMYVNMQYNIMYNTRSP